jgi:hypothetical protein
MKKLLVIALLAVATSAFAELPIRELTPGAVNPDVTQENILDTICVSGWTKTIRPPTSYTNRLKKQQLKEYGRADPNMKLYEEDHLIPLELGGHPKDPKNLWPEPWDGDMGARRKDVLEHFLKRQVCSFKIPLRQAQEEIAVDWEAAYKKYIKPKK